MSNSSAEPTPEAEGVPVSVAEMLVPPLTILVLVIAGLISWVLIHRRRAQKKPFNVSRGLSRRASTGSLQSISFPGNKVQDKTPEKSTGLRSLKPLFEESDLYIVKRVHGQGSIETRELLNILLPVIFSLGFCPLTLLMSDPIIEYLWPTDMYTTRPNINDAIGCFMVPAGMVYAISFGFAFEQASASFQEVAAGVSKQAEQLDKLLTLINNLTCADASTRLALLSLLKDVALTSASRMFGHKERKDIAKDLEDMLRLLYSSNASEVKDNDQWQGSVFDRLEKHLTEDEVLTTRIVHARIPWLQWTFLETLGYFTFLGVVLITCSSARCELAMCLISVISISFLCYIVADLDSPFYGVFRVKLDCFCDVIDKLDDAYHTEAFGSVILEKTNCWK